ncbi:MAG TPA: hypothetical protein VF800_15795 [Telluria sp.]|jgi:hypothetical protein
MSSWNMPQPPGKHLDGMILLTCASVSYALCSCQRSGGPGVADLQAFERLEPKRRGKGRFG